MDSSDSFERERSRSSPERARPYNPDNINRTAGTNPISSGPRREAERLGDLNYWVRSSTNLNRLQLPRSSPEMPSANRDPSY